MESFYKYELMFSKLTRIAMDVARPLEPAQRLQNRPEGSTDAPDRKAGQKPRNKINMYFKFVCSSC
jgi:hypothetical protein